MIPDSRARCAECRVAIMTAVALHLPLAVSPKLPNCGVLASLAGHGLLLDFSRGKPDNGFAVLVRASSALGFSPALDWRRKRGFLPNHSVGGDLGFIGNLLSLKCGPVSAGPFAFIANSLRGSLPPSVSSHPIDVCGFEFFHPSHSCRDRRQWIGRILAEIKS